MKSENAGITGGFWRRFQQKAIHNVIPYQWEALNDRIAGAEPSGAIHNYKVAAGIEDGEFIGLFFQDSDLSKWIEAAAYSLAIEPDALLERNIDEAIDLMAQAQREDGYLDTFILVKEKGKEFTDLRNWHEMYIAGHMLEAAVAYCRVTGKDKLLEVAKRYIDCIMNHVGPEEGKLHGYTGHEELELALAKLYRLQGERKYLDYAAYLIDERGKEPNFFIEESIRRGVDKEWNSDFEYEGTAYHQAHKPVRNQEVAIGHAVRAGYLYSGMADIAELTQDEALKESCMRIFDNIANKQMYITGSIGQMRIGEAFSCDYDLPNDTIYGETCAAISLVFFAKRMIALEKDGKYADVMERALYNGILSGISLDGRKFFYVNPLEVWEEPGQGNLLRSHVEKTRQPWFGCACCPPNIARLLTSLGDYVYTPEQECLYIDLYAQSCFEAEGFSVCQITEYPNDGQVRIEITGDMDRALALRIPGWCKDMQIDINGQPVADALRKKGYLYLAPLKDGDILICRMSMEPQFVRANGKVREDIGKIAVMRGPFVYCLEETDNPFRLCNCMIHTGTAMKASYHKDLLGGVTAIDAQGFIDLETHSQLYYEFCEGVKEPISLRFVPYYAWNNRGEGEMTVWVRYC